MIITAKALLDRDPHPTDSEIRAAMDGNLCRCGTYDRFLRAVRRASGNPMPAPAYEQRIADDSSSSPSSPNLPSPLRRTPNLDDWVRVNEDGTITVFTGKVELGQDIRTSFAMIGADELDVALDRIRVVMADTEASPDEGYTVSSMSLETSGNAIRYAAAELRLRALEVAFEELEAPQERLTVTDGTISDPVTGRSVTYWDLFGGKKLGGQVTGRAQPKQADDYTIVGHPVRRFDLLAKVTGTHTFVQDLELPDMVHGRAVRPPSYDDRLVSVDVEGILRMPGVLRVVRDGSFLAVIAEREEHAVRAMEALQAAAVWKSVTELPSQEGFFDYVLNQPDEAYLLVDGSPVDGPIPPIEVPADAVNTVAATYARPYHMHASLGPSAAVAQWVDDKLTVWSHTQGPYPLRAELALVLELPEDAIHVIHMDGPGCYGHNGADDAALDAALLARALPGRPVSLKWMRADEHAWEPYGTATVIRMQGSVNADGEVVDWNHDVWGYSHSARSRGVGGTSSLLAAWYLEEPLKRPQSHPMMGPQSGIHRNAEPLYTFPNRRIVKHFLPDSPLRVSALRGLGSYANVFAIESFVDELAHAAGVDPVALRLKYLAGDEEQPSRAQQLARARAVIEAAVAKAGPKPAGVGRGVAFSQYKNRQSYVAVVVDLTVERDSGRVQLRQAVVAVDAGQIVNPDGLSNQLEGALTQSASWTLNEQVTFDRHRITSVDWRTYPILRFGQMPEVHTVLLDRPGRPYLGIGEGAQGPTPAAIANAIYDAVGVRLRQIPFTPERVLEALATLESV